MAAAIALVASLGLLLPTAPAVHVWTAPAVHGLTRCVAPIRMQLSMAAARPIEVLPTPSAEELANIKGSWGTWGCGVSEFPWSYSDDETAYILEGEVTVIPDDKSLPVVTCKAGDYVKFPKGMSCVWKVTAAISKHYNFG